MKFYSNNNNNGKVSNKETNNNNNNSNKHQKQKSDKIFDEYTLSLEEDIGRKVLIFYNIITRKIKLISLRMRKFID